MPCLVGLTEASKERQSSCQGVCCTSVEFYLETLASEPSRLSEATGGWLRIRDGCTLSQRGIRVL